MRHPAHPDCHRTWFNSAFHGPAVVLPLLNAGLMSVGTAAALPALGSVVGAAGLAASAVGSISAGKQASASAKYNAQVQENNATVAKQNATFAGEEGTANAAIEQAKTRATVGGIKAAQAANGVDVNTGSAVDVRSSASELGELNAINIRSNAARHAYGFQTEAVNDQAQAQLDRSEAKYDKEAGYVKAGTTLLGGITAGSQSGVWGNFLNSGSMNAPTSMGPWQ